MLVAAMRRSAPLACLLASACYVSTASAPGAIRPGQSVHLELNDAGTASLTGVLGPRALALDGRVVARSDSALDVAVTDITRIGGGEESWHGATVSVPQSALARSDTRRFATVQTVLVAGASIAALVLAARALRGGDDIAAGRGGGGQEPGK